MVMLKTNTQTITLDGVEQEVRFNRNYPYFWVQNQGDGDVLISIDSGISEGKDGVIVVPSGGTACTMHNGYERDRFYLLGTGGVQVMGTSSAHNPFKSAQKGGGSGGGYTLPIATTTILGGVILDGTTITADENGVISAVGGGGSSVQSDILLDITVTKGDTSNGDYSSCSPPNNSIITLDGNITDYTFLYILNTYNNNDKFLVDPGLPTFTVIPSFVYTDGILATNHIRNLGNVAYVYLVSQNQIKLEFINNTMTKCRCIIIGIK